MPSEKQPHNFEPTPNSETRGANNPRRHAQAILRRTWKRIHQRVVPRLIRSGYSPGPTYIHIQLTFKCNLRCSFCSQWGDVGLFKNLHASEIKQVLPLSVLQRVMGELHSTCQGVYLWGGETLQYPDLIPLICYIKQSGRFCGLVTNGTFLSKYARPLVEAGIDGIDVSLDALEETHDRLRGARGTFQAALQGIRILQAARSARGTRTPQITISTVLVPEAAEELPALIRQLRIEGVDGVLLSKLNYATKQQGEAHATVFQRLFQITPTSWKGFVLPMEPGAPARVKAVVEELRADPANKDFVHWWEPYWSPQDFFNFYGDPTTAVPPHRACRSPWDAVNIGPNGDVYACPDYPDTVVGNVMEESFPQIWNSLRFVEFRRKLAAQGRFPICTSCCHLYG